MTSTYYRYLIIAFIVCSAIPVGYYFVNIPQSFAFTSQTVKPTTYEFEQVDHPIQPIPRKLSIDKNWAILGKALFNSTLLSKDNTISCASCHMVSFGGDDGFAVSTGVNNAQGTRNSPTVLNAVFNIRQFWDGRSASLAEQVAGPIHNPVEMATSWPDIVKKLSVDTYFSETFKRLSKDGVTANNIIQALTIYEESLITPNSPIDRYILGDETALSPQQKRGYEKFTRYGCTTCHQGRNIGGNILQKLGRISEIPESLTHDTGRFLVTEKPIDKFVFKVPSLRNVADTAPYFHNGSINTLSEAVQIMAKTQLGITLNQEDTDDIVALLQSFSAKPMEVINNEPL